MKKLFAAIISLLLVITTSSAETSKYFGTWVSISYLSDTYSLVLFQLFEDHTAYYLSRDVEDNEIGKYIESMIEWEQTEDGIILHISEQRDYKLYDYAEGWLYDGGPLFVTYFHKTFPVSVPSAGSMANDSPSPAADLPAVPAEGLTIPNGVYIADEDFPAGTYRIELVSEKDTGIISLYRKKDDVNRAFSYLFEYSLGPLYGSSVIGKMEISPGNALRIINTTIKLLPYEGLK